MEYPVVERLRSLMGNASRENMRDYERTAADAVDRILALEAAHNAEMRRVGDLQAALRFVAAELGDGPLTPVARVQLAAYVRNELTRLGG